MAKIKTNKLPRRTERATETRKLDQLKPHPRQAEDFGDLPDHQFKVLCDDIHKNGLKEKIEILPNGTIISGHQRRRALLKLGRVEVDVDVRYDLQDASNEAVEYQFIIANAGRRQLTRIQQARLAIRLIEIEKAKPRGRLLASNHQEARDRAAKYLGMSGRNLSRYIRVLMCPLEIQKAFDSNLLSLPEAEHCANLSVTEQEKLATKLRSVTNRAEAKKFFAKAQASQPKPKIHPTDELKRLSKHLIRACANIAPHVDRVNPATIHSFSSVLRRSRILFRELLARCPQE